MRLLDFHFFQKIISRIEGRRSSGFYFIFQKPYYGFTLLELIIVMAIIGALSSIAVPMYSEYIGRARITVAIANIRLLETEIDAFRIYKGRLPNDLSEIDKKNFLDPWGNPYEYLNYATMVTKGKDKDRTRRDRFLKPLNQDYDLYSKGKDQDSKPPLTAKVSLDDIVRANDGGFVGLASNFSP